jgi:hypothetical protein
MNYMVVIAGLSAPIMLFVKPCVLGCCHKKAHPDVHEQEMA